MDEKSFVSLEQRVCQVCGHAFETGSILLQKHLRGTLSHHTTTGWGLCPEHQRLFDAGFVALVECDPQRSRLQAGATTLKQEDACRTGLLAHIRREAFGRLFNVSIADDLPCVFVEPGVIEKLQATAPSSDQT